MSENQFVYINFDADYPQLASAMRAIYGLSAPGDSRLDLSHYGIPMKYEENLPKLEKTLTSLGTQNKVQFNGEHGFANDAEALCIGDLEDQMKVLSMYGGSVKNLADFLDNFFDGWSL